MDPPSSVPQKAEGRAEKGQCVRALAREKGLGHLRALAAQRARGQYTYICGVSRMWNAQPTHYLGACGL